MVTVTDRAADHLQEMLTKSNAHPDEGVKLVPNGANSIGMRIEAAGAGDEVLRRDDHPLLIVDRRIAASLDGAEIDCEPAVADGQAQPEFKIRSRA